MTEKNPPQDPGAGEENAPEPEPERDESSQRDDKDVDETVEETFPASDPPAW